MKFQVTQVQGRSYVETMHAKDLPSLLNFLTKVSTAKIKYIKKFITLKLKNKPKITTKYKELIILAKSKSYTDKISIKYPNPNLTRENIEKIIIDNCSIQKEPIISILSVLYKKFN